MGGDPSGTVTAAGVSSATAEAHVIHMQEERLEVEHMWFVQAQAFTHPSSMTVSGLISVAVSLLTMLIGLVML